MDDKRDTVVWEDIRCKGIPGYDFLHIVGGLLGVPWGGMNKTMDGTLSP